MRERCKNSEEVCQDWPKKGNLKKNLDKRLNTLKGVLKNEDGMVYAYVLTTVGKNGNRFVQKGSALLDDVKSVKNSGSDRCGDIYEPKSNISGGYDISSYYEPLVGHVHRETEQSDDWHSDINYKSRRTGRRPVLLVGDPCYSFLWSSPIAYSSSKLPRTKKWDNVQHFIYSLASK